MSRSLARLPVLLLDCQTTGANPARGHLLEIAWCRTTAAETLRGARPAIDSHVVALPGGARIPRRITRMTGIRGTDLAGASEPETAHTALREALTACASSVRAPVLVAHFARFERGFVDDLCTRFGASPPDVYWLCTHEIVCRLLPDLPHRGLRAVAGRLGHVVTEAKRAADHVAATAAVWAGLVERLAEEGVTTLGELRTWTDVTPPVRRVGRAFSLERAERLALPTGPGVYRMLGARRRLLYVGKATSLRRRVNSYFQKRRHAAPRTMEMLTQVVDVDVTETGSPLEAALLETDLIKECAPPYNVALRDRTGHVFHVAEDLGGVRSSPDGAHRLGPVSQRGVLDAWVALRRLLGEPGQETPELFVQAMGLPDGVRPDVAVARAGLAAFAVEEALPSDGVCLRRRLTGVGTRAWRAYQEALAAEAEAADDDRDGEPDVETDNATDEDAPREPWSPETPEQVVRLLRGSAMHGARMLRRGRWLCALSESTLVWRPPVREDDAPHRVLVLSRGRIVEETDAEPGTEPPVPPGHSRDALTRRRAFDVATLDRLRVLTTELRRLVAAGVPVDVCFGPGHRLDRASLARRLYWV